MSRDLVEILKESRKNSPLLKQKLIAMANLFLSLIEVFPAKNVICKFYGNCGPFVVRFPQYFQLLWNIYCFLIELTQRNFFN